MLQYPPRGFENPGHNDHTVSQLITMFGAVAGECINAAGADVVRQLGVVGVVADHIGALEIDLVLLCGAAEEDPLHYDRIPEAMHYVARAFMKAGPPRANSSSHTASGTLHPTTTTTRKKSRGSSKKWKSQPNDNPATVGGVFF